MTTNPMPVGTTPRMAGTFVCDMYLVSVSGFEKLVDRRFYDKPGPAKAMRTTFTKRHKYRFDSWKRALANGHAVHLDYIGTRGNPADEVWDIRVDVYTITPNGYEVVP